MAYLTAVPKPAPRPPRDRRRLGRASKAKRDRRRRYRDAIRDLPIPPPPVPKGTKHARREREWGRMAFARYGGCDVWFAYAEEFKVIGAVHAGIGPCSGPIQYMHLHLGKTAGRRRAPDHSGACGCETHHQGIDGKEGGKAPWYVSLGYDGQQALKHRLVARQRARWDELGDKGRAFWDRKAAADRGR